MKFFRHEHHGLSPSNTVPTEHEDIQAFKHEAINMTTIRKMPSNMKPSNMKPFKHEALQKWRPSNMKPFKHDETFSSLQTWSHQHDNPRKDASKHEAIRHEALQKWRPSNMMPSKQFTKSILIRSTNRLSSSSQMNEDCNVQLGIQGPIAVLRLHFKLPLPFEFESLSGVLL